MQFILLVFQNFADVILMSGFLALYGLTHLSDMIVKDRITILQLRAMHHFFILERDCKVVNSLFMYQHIYKTCQRQNDESTQK